jgi:IS5 family transposase
MCLSYTRFKLLTKRTRKREFMVEMNLTMQWTEVLSLIAPYGPAARTGRPANPAQMILRIHLLQLFFGNSNPAMEEAMHYIPLYC